MTFHIYFSIETARYNMILLDMFLFVLYSLKQTEYTDVTCKKR